MRRGVLCVFVAVAWAVAAAAAGLAQGGSPNLVQGEALKGAQQQFVQNVALGDSGHGRASATGAARIGQLATEGTAQTKAFLATHPKSAEARNLVGLFLTVAYRPGEAEAAGGVKLRRGSAAPEEMEQGLGELRAAIALGPKQVSYRLDYAWALALAGRRNEAQAQLREVGQRFPKLSPGEQDRLTQLRALAGIPAPTKPVVQAPPKEITWVSFDDALAQARREKKLVLADFMAEWCGWCKKMDREVYVAPRVIALGRQYVFARVDGDREPELARRYGVTGYPTTVVMDAQGRERKRVVGYMPAERFLQEFE